MPLWHYQAVVPFHLIIKCQATFKNLLLIKRADRAVGKKTWKSGIVILFDVKKEKHGGEGRGMKASCFVWMWPRCSVSFFRDMNNPNHMLFYCLELRGRRERNRLLAFPSWVRELCKKALLCPYFGWLTLQVPDTVRRSGWHCNNEELRFIALCSQDSDCRLYSPASVTVNVILMPRLCASRFLSLHVKGCIITSPAVCFHSLVHAVQRGSPVQRAAERNGSAVDKQFLTAWGVQGRSKEEEEAEMLYQEGVYSSSSSSFSTRLEEALACPVTHTPTHKPLHPECENEWAD